MSTETGSRCTSDPESSLAKGTSGHYAGWAELHRTVPEQRPHGHAFHERVRRGLAQPLDLAHQPASTGFVRSPMRSTDTVTVSPGRR